MAEKKAKEPQQGEAATTKAAKPARKPAKPKPKRKNLPQFNVVLLDDDDHSYQYVIEMLLALFAHPVEKGMLLAKEVDTTGRVIVMTTHKEAAELKRDQVLAYGADPRIQRCRGSMTAIIEPTTD
jgi:ATP-dependent Clp protease adaptor protein ClpS